MLQIEPEVEQVGQTQAEAAEVVITVNRADQVL
jgi:hypothetical protein